MSQDLFSNTTNNEELFFQLFNARDEESGNVIALNDT